MVAKCKIDVINRIPEYIFIFLRILSIQTSRNLEIVKVLEISHFLHFTNRAQLSQDPTDF